jgi:glycosyltransferase involved in cell wall biosynthesis
MNYDNDQPDKWLVALLGSRMHYAIPRMFYRAGLLKKFYTDFYAERSWLRYSKHFFPISRIPSLTRLNSRNAEDIPYSYITAFNSFGIHYAIKLRQAKTPSEISDTFLWAGKKFCNLILKKEIDNISSIYTFNTAGLELLKFAQSQKLFAVTEQTMAPLQVESEILKEEHTYFPDWETLLPKNISLDKLSAREEEEWSTANMVLCGSDFVKQEVVKCGGAAEKCKIIPYGVDIKFWVPNKPYRDIDTRLKVLTIGTVGLRKGTPYVMNVAKALSKLAEFKLVGSTKDISSAAISNLVDKVKLIGLVPKSQVYQYYAWADVFLLPSLCEGSATVTYEAMASGLPVICTPNTGSVVRDGIDGFIVPIRDPEAIMSKLELLSKNPDLLMEMSNNARERAKEFTLDKYQERLLQTVCP